MIVGKKVEGYKAWLVNILSTIPNTKFCFSDQTFVSCRVAECTNTDLRILCLFCGYLKNHERTQERKMLKEFGSNHILLVLFQFYSSPSGMRLVSKNKNIHFIWNQDSNPGTSYLSYYLEPDSSSGYYLLLLPI